MCLPGIADGVLLYQGKAGVFLAAQRNTPFLQQTLGLRLVEIDVSSLGYKYL